ncbi:MAG: hypothetical protein A2X94_06805 [Bdellovibrionales bacterium GWB1_55_8]|nr:MAG: hypothetical protein A2X94_06805 [Bdellovibrionales bacterium GWB1_55_8]
MAAKEDIEKIEAPVSASSGGGGSKLVLILTGINTLVTLGMLGILFVAFQRDQKTPAIEDLAANSPAAQGDGKGEHGAKGAAEAKKPTNFGKMVTLDQFTVNLATPGSVNPKFVRVNISLEVPNEDSESEVNLKMPQVRNVVIDLFNSKRPADLATAEGRDYLKEEIRSALNAFLVTGKVKGVFFTNFALSS